MHLDLYLSIEIDRDIEYPSIPRELGIGPSPVVADPDGGDAVDDTKRPGFQLRHEDSPSSGNGYVL
jgi:hypothetical protein